ncbi:MAG: serine/threonine-protein kinase [Fibrobacterota bacterium]
MNQDKFRGGQDDFDKTIAEGNLGNSMPVSNQAQAGNNTFIQPSQKQPVKPTLSGMNSQQGMVNPYTQTGAKVTPLTTVTQAVRLPDGNQAIPLGSGIIAGTLGEGGMARVYRVWNEKFEMYRAVKVLLPTERPELMERFETEIKISAKLRHPNIVETYAVGDWNGLPYIEMELVEGVSLDSLIKEHGKIPPVICTAIGIQVASALAYAHTEQFLLYGKTYNGIIHRDLKPANIMIGQNGVVKLMDFGIARPSEVGLHTVAGNIVGTLPYLSPEQLDESEIDQRSDIYSLGTIMYESLTGEKTFPQQTVTNLMRMKIINSYRKFDALSIDVHPHLAKAVEKCLSQDKNERFTTSKEFEDTLKLIFKHLTNEPIDSVLQKFVNDPNSFVLKPGKKKRKLKKLVPVFIGAGVVAVIGAVAGLLIAFPPEKMDQTNVATPDTMQTVIDTPKVVKAPDTQVVIVPPPIETIPQVVAVKNDPVTYSHAVKPNKPKQPTAPKNPPQQLISNSQTTSNESPVDALIRKYGESDLVEVAEAASRNGVWNDVITAIENMPPDSPKKTKGNILLVFAYVEQGKAAKASQVLGSFTSDDAFYVLLEGRIAFIQGKDKRALDKFDEALTRPSNFRNTLQVRNDALYFTAVTYDNRYNATLSPEARQQAMMAWNTLKRVYISQPDHPRFKLANQKLASF